jgi:hypothetical protein
MFKFNRSLSGPRIMPKRKGDLHPRGELDPLDRVMLQHVHAWGIGAARPFASILGLPYSTCTYRLRRLAQGRYIASLGHPSVSPTDWEFLRYYRPVVTKARISDSFIPRARVVPLSEPSFLPLKDGFLPRHHVEVLITAEWLAFLLREWGTSCNIVPEFILRYGRGWYGSGRAPRHPNPILTMVPDFLLLANDIPVHVEVELSVKSTERYRADFLRLRPSNRPVIYVVPDEAVARRVSSRLPARLLNTAVICRGDEDGVKQTLERFSAAS